MTPVVPSAVNQSFNGKPQASFLNFAYAYGSPLNENAQTLELGVANISRWALAHGSEPDASAFRLITQTQLLS